LGGSGGDDDAVETEASGRRPIDALNVSAGSVMARRRENSKAIEIGPTFMVL